MVCKLRAPWPSKDILYIAGFETIHSFRDFPKNQVSRISHTLCPIHVNICAQKFQGHLSLSSSSSI